MSSPAANRSSNSRSANLRMRCGLIFVRVPPLCLHFNQFNEIFVWFVIYELKYLSVNGDRIPIKIPPKTGALSRVYWPIPVLMLKGSSSIANEIAYWTNRRSAWPPTHRTRCTKLLIIIINGTADDEDHMQITEPLALCTGLGWGSLLGVVGWLVSNSVGWRRTEWRWKFNSYPLAGSSSSSSSSAAVELEMFHFAWFRGSSSTRDGQITDFIDAIHTALYDRNYAINCCCLIPVETTNRKSK